MLMVHTVPDHKTSEQNYAAAKCKTLASYTTGLL